MNTFKWLSLFLLMILSASVNAEVKFYDRNDAARGIQDYYDKKPARDLQRYELESRKEADAAKKRDKTAAIKARKKAEAAGIAAAIKAGEYDKAKKKALYHGALTQSPDLISLEDGNGLLDVCKVFDKKDRVWTKTNTANSFRCTGFIQGFIEGHDFAVLPTGLWQPISDFVRGCRIPTAFCFPKRVTMGQLIKVVIAYLEKHPESLHKDSGPLMGAALWEAFPCQK